VPNSSGSLTAVVVSGGKQYRVAPGDQILVDRIAAEPGAELTFDRVLLVAGGDDDFKVGAEALKGQTVTARVLSHRRGPKIDVLRYKSKKRVRVHRGARADLTAVQIVAIGDASAGRPEQAGTAKPAARKPAGKRSPAKAAAAEAE